MSGVGIGMGPRMVNRLILIQLDREQEPTVYCALVIVISAPALKCVVLIGTAPVALRPISTMM